MLKIILRSFIGIGSCFSIPLPFLSIRFNLSCYFKLKNKKYQKNIVIDEKYCYYGNNIMF